MNLKLLTHGVALALFVFVMFLVRDTAPNWVIYLLFGGATGALMMALKYLAVLADQRKD